MRPTTVWEKLFASLVNLVVVGALWSLLWLWFTTTDAVLLLLILFFAYQAVTVEWFPGSRDVGMMVVKSYWEKKYPKLQLLWYALLYTMSVATIFIHLWFLFDLLLFNMLLQTFCVLRWKTTLHGLLAGRVTTVRHVIAS